MDPNILKHPIASVRKASSHLKGSFDVDRSRQLHITGVAGAGNSLLALGKLIIGLASFSIFLCLNSLYMLGMIVARYLALYGLLQSNDIRQQYIIYKRCGWIVLVGSTIYVIYSIVMYFSAESGEYSMYAGIAIAAFTFVEIGLSIRGTFIERNNKQPLVQAIKLVNLATSLISLTLTQIAILSFTDKSIDPIWNSVGGIFFGACAGLIGVFMIARATRKLAAMRQKIYTA